MTSGRPKISVRDLVVTYGRTRALNGLSVDVRAHEILTVIGPANSGKTSFLRCLNRMIDLDLQARVKGSITLDEIDIRRGIPAEDLRQRVGMIFAMPIPLPLSIRDNVAYGPRMSGLRDKAALDRVVEDGLRAAYLWDEVKDRLGQPALKLSGGQQQRLCIARTLALDTEVILFDEPTSGLDPISTAKVEEAMTELRKTRTIVLVTNNTKQAARVGVRTAFFLMGDMVEVGPTEEIFTAPRDQRTEDYIVGRFG